MNLVYLILTVVSATVWPTRKRRSPENFLHKHDKNMDKFIAKYEKAKLKFDKEKDPTVILIWWAPAYPSLKKYASSCG